MHDQIDLDRPDPGRARTVLTDELQVLAEAQGFIERG